MAVHRAGVPGNRDSLRLVVGKQLEQHVREAQKGVGRKAFRRRKLLREREVRAVRKVVSIDEEELGVVRRRVVEIEFDTRESLRAHRYHAIVPAPMSITVQHGDNAYSGLHVAVEPCSAVAAEAPRRLPDS